MLNIPESVKTLFKQDGVRKNFRVQFPNGELPDITNENVVQESVKFTDSICSQDVLKFGLTEASVLEFETVGIANMYGMTIEAGIEIDLSSLTAAQISEIESGAWDGVYVDAANSDIGFAYFRIPYGQFRIDSCPRDHQAMAHRKVTAYGASPLKVRNNPFESKKQSTFNLPSIYNANMFLLTTEVMGYNMPATLDSFTATDLTVTGSMPFEGGSDGLQVEVTKIVKTRSGNKTLHFFVISYLEYSTGAGTLDDPKRLEEDGLFSITFNTSYFTILSQIADALENDAIGIDLEGSGYSSWLDMARSLLTDSYGMNWLYPSVAYYLMAGGGSGAPAVGYRPYQKIDFESSCPVFYPYVGEYTEALPPYGGTSYTNHGIAAVVMYPRSIFCYDLDSRISIRATAPTCKVLRLSGTLPSATFPFPSVSQGSVNANYLGTGNIKLKAYNYKPEGNLVQLINSWLELNAKFGKANMQGAFEEVQLSKGDPVAVPPGLFESFWWDEYDVLPVGSVIYKIKVNEEEREVTYTFGDGASVYDMTDNLIISSCASEQEANALLDEYFIPNLDPITFTPIELTMKGLPYIEAGDYLAVTAEDGTIANSFNMRQTINGIQVLTAEIESTSGDIIESEEGET